MLIYLPGGIAQPVTCLTADTCLTAEFDPSPVQYFCED